jgi:hypothetical protein
MHQSPERNNLYGVKMADFLIEAGVDALGRLLNVAHGDKGQSRRVANFLLAWHNAEENGGWDPIDLWNVDAGIADDMLRIIRLIRQSHSYPGELGFYNEIQAVWAMWRKPARQLTGAGFRVTGS